MRFACVALLPLMFGCSGIANQYVRAEAGPELSCPGSAISITQHDTETIAVGWTARGCGREAECGYVDESMRCHETARSKALVAEVSMTDRLAMETDCDPSRVKVVKRGAWSKAGETAYRMDACDKPYVCSSGRAGISCKAALATDAAPVTAEAP